MQVLFLLLLVSFLIALVFLIVFLLSVKKGEFDDLDGPPVRVLTRNKSSK